MLNEFENKYNEYCNNTEYDINDLLSYDNLDKVVYEIKNKYDIKELKFYVYTTEKHECVDSMTLDNIYTDFVDIYNWLSEIAYYNDDEYNLTVKITF